MNISITENVLSNPKEYVREIYSKEFFDVNDGISVFKNIQPRSNDEFENFVMSVFTGYKVNWNFVRRSPLNQEEPNFIHRDDMMGDITCVLYLNESPPEEDGTTIYDDNYNPLCKIHSKFNRMVSFDSDALHGRNIYENFGEGKGARLIQVIFLSQSK